jgi:hypothetical protein
VFVRRAPDIYRGGGGVSRHFAMDKWYDSYEQFKERQCPSKSPIYKGDLGPHRCLKEKGHEGNHACYDKDTPYRYLRTWNPA